MRILVVEDNLALSSALQEALEQDGHAVDCAHDGVAGLDLLGAFPYDLILLDVTLPGSSGLELCSKARERHVSAPILMLTARDTLADKVAGLDSGADDYMVKPFELPELKARVRALLRRATPHKQSILQVGDLALDPATGDVRRAGRPLKLHRKERALLEVLMRQAGRIVTRDQIIEHLYDLEAEPSPEVIRAHIKGLRKAIGDDGDPRLIQTVHGIGYRMAAHVPAP